jgi:hypothetical protein
MPKGTRAVAKVPRTRLFASAPHADGFFSLLHVPGASLALTLTLTRSCKLLPGHALGPSARFTVVCPRQPRDLRSIVAAHRIPLRERRRSRRAPHRSGLDVPYMFLRRASIRDTGNYVKTVHDFVNGHDSERHCASTACRVPTSPLRATSRQQAVSDEALLSFREADRGLLASMLRLRGYACRTPCGPGTDGVESGQATVARLAPANSQAKDQGETP